MPPLSRFLVFLRPSDKPFQDRSSNPSLLRSVGALRQLLRSTELSQAIVVMGRRSNLSEEEREQLRQYNASLSPVTVHTYDWLIDLVLNLEAWAIYFAMSLRSWCRTDYDGFTPPANAALKT
jgi:hypothetical protein